jgi:hypothetical protein
MLKVGFLGNCQAQSMETWVRQVPGEIEVVAFPPIWLIEESDVGRVVSDIEACDYVFAQRLSDNFARPDLATSCLKNRYPNKIISWPNAYFDGYFPGISYRYTQNGKMLGPLDEYHWDIIDLSHKEGLTVEECVDRLTGDAVFDLYADAIGQSLQSLSARESGLDTIISDYVATNLHSKRLFFSMNHPVNELIFEIMYRLFGSISERRRLSGLAEFGYPLNKVILPVLPAIARRCHIEFSEDDGIKGVEVHFRDGKFMPNERPKIYSYEELIECFYRIYDLNLVG